MLVIILQFNFCLIFALLDLFGDIYEKNKTGQWDDNPVNTQFSNFEFGYGSSANTKYALTITPIGLPYILLFFYKKSSLRIYDMCSV